VYLPVILQGPARLPRLKVTQPGLLVSQPDPPVAQQPGLTVPQPDLKVTPPDLRVTQPGIQPVQPAAAQQPHLPGRAYISGSQTLGLTWGSPPAFVK
jgi:hypothetical protein